MNVTHLLTGLQARHDETTSQAEDLRRQIAHLTAALTQTEARLTELDTTQKIIREIAQAAAALPPAEPVMTYQEVIDAFNHQPDRAFRVRDLHELLDLPTEDSAMNVTRARLGRLVRQGFLTQPGRGLYQKRT